MDFPASHVAVSLASQPNQIRRWRWRIQPALVLEWWDRWLRSALETHLLKPIFFAGSMWIWGMMMMMVMVMKLPFPHHTHQISSSCFEDQHRSEILTPWSHLNLSWDIWHCTIPLMMPNFQPRNAKYQIKLVKYIPPYLYSSLHFGWWKSPFWMVKPCLTPAFLSDLQCEWSPWNPWGAPGQCYPTPQGGPFAWDLVLRYSHHPSPNSRFPMLRGSWLTHINPSCFDVLMFSWPVKIWLVVWNIWIILAYIGNVIIPTDFHIFQRGWLKPPTSII